MKKALEEVNKQIEKAKTKVFCNTFNLIGGVILTLTLIFAIFGIPLIIGSIYGLMSNKKKLDNLKIKKAELEDKKW